jgi:hypothetical protein
VQQPNEIKLLVWPTLLRALIERKTVFAVLANRVLFLLWSGAFAYLNSELS